MRWHVRAIVLGASALGMIARDMGRGPGDAEPSPRPVLRADQAGRRDRPRGHGRAPQEDRRGFQARGGPARVHRRCRAHDRQGARRGAAGEGQAPAAGSPAQGEGQDEGAAQSPRSSRGGHVVPLFRRHDRLRDRRSGDRPGGEPGGGPASSHPLSDEEYEEAKALAKERSEQVKALYQKFGDSSPSIPSSASSRSRTTRVFTG